VALWLEYSERENKESAMCGRWPWRGARFLIIVCALAILALAWVAPVPAAGARSDHGVKSASPTDVGFPAIDPEYLYTQLATMVTTYQSREAGYDTAQSNPNTGHDGFATYWQAEMLRNLSGFGATAVRDSFAIDGWQGRPATSPAFNVEVSVPGVTHPEQVVVIGCHYDGEADSTQSANDDGSGCAIELAVARALGIYWSAHHVYPARTLRFVIFDAEEQGVFGSFHYVNQTINSDLGNVVAMLNEEQNGIEYPLRFLGKMSNPLLPTTIFVTPLSDNEAYNNTSTYTATDVANIKRFHTVEEGAAPAVFAAFRALGYTSLMYRDSQNNPVSQQIFTTADLSHVTQQEDNIASSDQYAFSLDGLPAATYIGNFSYYDRNPPPWSYPYDQPQDTIQLMNIFASGAEAPAEALKLSLALPGMLTTWTLAQPDVLGFSAAPAGPVAAIADLGVIAPNQVVNLTAQGVYDPANPNASFNATWSFGDGTTAKALTAGHVWTTAGTYQLTLTVADSAGSRTITKTIQVTNTPVNIANPYTKYGAQDGIPPANPQVTLPTAENGKGASSAQKQQSGLQIPGWIWSVVIGLALILSLLAIVIGVWRRRPATAGAPGAPTSFNSAEDVAARRRRENALQDLLKPRDEP
jgi:PKD repeat protein